MSPRKRLCTTAFESDITPAHNISVGASLNHDYFKEEHSSDLTMGQTPTETTAGVYAQYTFKDGDRWTVMPGIRWDHSSVYGSFVTPRLHIKYTPTKVLTMRAAVGKGYRTPHALAENTPLLACGRTFYFADSFRQEKRGITVCPPRSMSPLPGKSRAKCRILLHALLRPDGHRRRRSYGTQ